MALALIGDPELVFLDEPTTGFDPAARQPTWDVIAGLRDLGKTIFLTAHYVEEAERLADRIAVIAAGRIVAEGTPASLGGRDAGASVVTFTLPPGVSAAGLPSAMAAAVTGGPGEKVEARVTSPLPEGGKLAALVTRQSWRVNDLGVVVAGPARSRVRHDVLQTAGARQPGLPPSGCPLPVCLFRSLPASRWLWVAGTSRAESPPAGRIRSRLRCR